MHILLNGNSNLHICDFCLEMDWWLSRLFLMGWTPASFWMVDRKLVEVADAFWWSWLCCLWVCSFLSLRRVKTQNGTPSCVSGVCLPLWFWFAMKKQRTDFRRGIYVVWEDEDGSDWLFGGEYNGFWSKSNKMFTVWYESIHLSAPPKPWTSLSLHENVVQQNARWLRFQREIEELH